MMKSIELLQSAQALLEIQPNTTSILANASAFLMESLEQLNWVGFYLFDGKNLTVGPFQGKVACSSIAIGKGVCGEAALTQKTLVVDNVLSYQNHIACDSNSKSEVVIPIFIKGRLFGVLDVDSPVFSRFDQDIVHFLEEFTKLLVKTIDI
ncbi:MAG: GAF domain-containing protein [Acholeplasmataceae bacterium]|nr:GAF domain-containing protein [Acholeplasmataceae bacterium]